MQKYNNYLNYICNHAIIILLNLLDPIMIIKKLTTKSEMLEHLNIIQGLYPSMTAEMYAADLEDMLGKNQYGQFAVFLEDACVGIAGFWIGKKLWCGKYLEIDNLIISKNYRSVGIGEKLFEHFNTLAIKEACTLIALDSYTSNFKAHKFFYNQGFSPKGFHFLRILDKSNIR